MKITVLNNQSVFDIAVRYCGNPLAAFNIALLNSISVDTSLSPGSEIEIPEFPQGKSVVDYFKSKNHQPATAWNPISDGGQPKPEGISYWAISDDFIITPQISIEP